MSANGATMGASMTGKFDQLPQDQGRTILSQRETRVGDIEALHQRWSWDGITAESLVFRSEDVAHLADEEVVRRLVSHPGYRPGAEVSLTRLASGDTFANFNACCDG
jgi:hypothetical protein